MTAATLAALDFTPAAPVCDAGDDKPATERAVSTCGCATLVCSDHAEALRRVRRLLKRTRQILQCRDCHAEPIMPAKIERIAA